MRRIKIPNVPARSPEDIEGKSVDKIGNQEIKL